MEYCSLNLYPPRKTNHRLLTKMDSSVVPTNVVSELLIPILKKILTNSKSSHLLRLDPKSNEIKLKIDKPHVGLIYLEAPYIALPAFDLLKLIERGKCCGYCGGVLKIYDNGKMKDDGNKSNREKQTLVDKHERYINGLDCSDCEVRWCDKQCKGLDFKHTILHHRPSNKSASHAFFDVNGNEKDTFFFDKWTKLKTILLNGNMDLIYNTFICILHLYYDPSLQPGFESLKCFTSDDEPQLERCIKSWNMEDIDLKSIWEDFLSCFKKFNVSYLKFLKYVAIFKLNNYNGSIYLIFSALTKSSTIQPNAKVEYYDGNKQHDYEEFSVRTGEDNSVHLVKEHVVDTPSVKPIYTNKTSGILDKKVIQVSNTSRISTTSQLVILDEDFSNPFDMEDDEIEFLSDGDSDSKIPKIVLPIFPSTTTQKNTTPKIRTASFTSSGASFGEGIIKYNRDQIREMLENMSHSMRLDEESSDEAEDAIEDEISSSVGSSVNRNIVSMMKNLQVNNAASQRRKSVKFEEKVTTI